MKLSSILLNLANLKQRIDQLAYNYGLPLHLRRTLNVYSN